MDRMCGCSGQQASARRELSCLRCGAACCPSCAFELDAVIYCARCAESVLDAEGIPLSLSPVAGRIWSQATREQRARAGPVAGWVILVARDQPDLFAHLLGAFARDDKVEVVLDRRRDYSRNPPGVEDRLRIHGAAVIRRRL